MIAYNIMTAFCFIGCIFVLFRTINVAFNWDIQRKPTKFLVITMLLVYSACALTQIWSYFYLTSTMWPIKIFVVGIVFQGVLTCMVVKEFTFKKGIVHREIIV